MGISNLASENGAKASTRPVATIVGPDHPDLWTWHLDGFDPTVRAAGFQGAGKRLAALRIEAPGGDYPIVATEDYIFQLDMSGGSAIDVEVDGAFTRYEGRRGTVFVWGPGVGGSVRRETCSSVLTVAVSKHVFGADDAIVADALARPIFSPQLARGLNEIWHHLPSAVGDTLVEDESIASLVSVLHICSARRPTPALLTKGRLALVLDHLDQVWAQAVTLKELATAAGMSETHFLRAFRNETGLPPHQYVLRRRLNEAADMLSRTDMLVSEIAHLCGFSSHAHFASAFERTRRLTPRQWREVSRRKKKTQEFERRVLHRPPIVSSSIGRGEGRCCGKQCWSVRFWRQPPRPTHKPPGPAYRTIMPRKLSAISSSPLSAAPNRRKTCRSPSPRCRATSSSVAVSRRPSI